MTGFWMRRALTAVVCASAALLAACGSSSIESAITPTRFVVFGDAMSDVGQGGSKYTVNDGTDYNTWIEKMVASFGLTVTPASAGGTGYAQGNARVTAKPDAAGNAATRSVKEQIDAFIASGGAWGSTDMTVINGGPSDIIAEVTAYKNGLQTEAQLEAHVRQAGTDLGLQVRRLVQAGAKYVVVFGTYNLSKTPWAKTLNEVDRVGHLTTVFNEALLVNIVDQGEHVLYVDVAYFVNLFVAVPGNYGMVNATDPVCTSVDPGMGIGVGTGQVNSALCNTSTLREGANYSQYLFADSVYLTPVALRQLGDLAYVKVRGRW